MPTSYVPTTWTSGHCVSVEDAMKCACTYIASVSDTTLTNTKIKMIGVVRAGSGFKGYLARVTVTS
jgi:hypothetical protein